MKLKDTAASFCHWVVVTAILCATQLAAHAQDFSFAWMSDTHVGSETAAEDLRASVSDINSMKDIAFTIISGDITELGWNAQFEEAKSILDSLRKPYYIIPGNHDTKWSESGCTRFDQLWGADRFDFEYSGYRFIGMHEGPIMRMGDGHFAPEDLRWLDTTLSRIHDRNQPLLFVTHYPLDSGIDNWYEVTDRLRHYNVKAVLVGHGHANHSYDFESLPGVMCRSNLRAKKPAGGYNIVHVRPDTIFFSERVPHSTTLRPWDEVPQEKSAALNETKTYPRPDYSINLKYPHMREEWRVETGYTIAAAPAIGNQQVFVGDASGTLHCLSLHDGSRVWRFRTGSAVYSTADVAEGKVVFGSADGNIYCLDATSGSLVWKVETAAPVVACPVIDSGTVYIGGGDSKFRAIDLSSGILRWQHEGISAFVETRPLIYQREVVFGAWDTYLYALNAVDGSLAWKWSNGIPTLNLSPAACWPVAADDEVYIVAPDRVMTAIDDRTGATVWRSNRYQVREAIGISNDHSRVYAKCMVDTLLAFSVLSRTPQLVWATPCGYGYDIDPSMPMEMAGVVYFGTKNGLVIAVEAKTGEMIWQHKIGVTIVNTPKPVGAGKVLVTDADGRIILLVNR